MKTRLPPITSIRAFEAASRHLSISKAAAELNVTTPAISHQIKLLESTLGKALFRRSNRRITLTDAGKAYAYYVHQAFQLLEDGTQQLTKTYKSDISISVEPSFAIYWLIPKLTDFQSQHPNIELKIAATYDLTDLQNDSFDLAIRWGKGNYDGLYAELLIHNTLVPVCSPILQKGKHPVRKPQDLLNSTILYGSQTDSFPHYPYWKQWFKKAGVDINQVKKILYFASGFTLLPAAIAGQGVALEMEIFVEKLIEQGTLITPLDVSLKEKTTGYYAVCQKASLKNKSIETFIKWLKDTLK